MMYVKGITYVFILNLKKVSINLNFTGDTTCKNLSQ